MSCSQYTKSSEEKDEMFAISSSIPCPKCSSRIQHFRNHGCHSIRCSICRVEFCYVCGIETSTLNMDYASHLCPIFCSEKCTCLPCEICSPGKKCPICFGCDVCNIKHIYQ
jgi:hypothetical protein